MADGGSTSRIGVDDEGVCIIAVGRLESTDLRCGTINFHFETGIRLVE